MKKTMLALTIAIMTMVMTSCNGDGGTSTQQDNSAQSEQQNQDSMATSLSEFKSTLPGTTWGAQYGA